MFSSTLCATQEVNAVSQQLPTTGIPADSKSARFVQIMKCLLVDSHKKNNRHFCAGLRVHASQNGFWRIQAWVFADAWDRHFDALHKQGDSTPGGMETHTISSYQQSFCIRTWMPVVSELPVYPVGVIWITWLNVSTWMLLKAPRMQLFPCLTSVLPWHSAELLWDGVACLQLQLPLYLL